MKMFKSICLLFFIVISQDLFAQSIGQEEDLISKDKLQQDLNFLKNNLEQVHAGLYTYTSKTEMDEMFLKIESSITQAMKPVDFYRLILPLHNKIRNGHSMIIPPQSWSNAVETRLPHFPFDIYRYKDHLYVRRNFSNNLKISPGDEIISINGETAIEAYDLLIKNATKDGENTTYADEIIHQDFSEFYINLFGPSDFFELKIKQKLVEEMIKVKALPIAEIRKVSKERYGYDKRPWYDDNRNPLMTFNIQNNVAILTIPTFSIDAIKEMKIKYKKFFKTVFQEIKDKNIQNLIIDIRENGGGNADVATEVFSYLHNEPFKLIKDIHAVTKKLPYKKHYQGNKFWLSLQMSLALKKVADNKFVPRKFVAKKQGLSLTPKKPSSPQFKGELYVLMNGWSFSASGMFTTLLKEYEKGIWIGEEAGGNPHTQVGDFEQMLILPHSGVRMLIPLFVQHMDVSFENTRKGLQPHHWVRNTITQELENEDAVMDLTLKLIAKNKK